MKLSRETFSLRRIALVLVSAAALTGVPVAGAAQINPHSPQSVAYLAREVRHQLLLLPTLTLFDNLQYDVRGTEVELRGQVVNDTTKHDAEMAVKEIDGVTNVIDHIEVLPDTPMDQQIMRAEYRAIYRDPGLERYAMGSLPSIHIIVNGGHVTLEGTVTTQSDKDLAGIRAKGVASAFSIVNNLRVVPPGRRNP